MESAVIDDEGVIPNIAIYEDQEREAWALPRPILREKGALFFAEDKQSEFARASFIEYHWRERRHRSRIYRDTLIRLREIGWSKGKQKEISMTEASPTHESRTKTGDLVYQARVAKGLTKSEAARLAGYSPSGWYSIEAGTRLPQPRKISGIAKGLGIDFQTLSDIVISDRDALDRRLGTAGHKTYYPAPSEPGEVNKRVVMDYLIDDMDFDKKKVAEVVEVKDEYTNEDIKGYIEALLRM